MSSLDQALQAELLKDGVLFAEEALRFGLTRLGVLLGCAVAAGVLGGLLLWLWFYFENNGTKGTEGDRCECDIQVLFRWTIRHPRIMLAINTVIMLGITAGVSYWVLNQAYETVEALDGQIANEALVEIAESFIANLNRLVTTGQNEDVAWKLMVNLTNPLDTDLLIEEFSGTLALQQVHGANFKPMHELRLGPFESGQLLVEFDITFVGVYIGAVLSLLSNQLGGLVYVGIDLTAGGTAFDREYAFFGHSNLPLSLEVLPPFDTWQGGSLLADNGRAIKSSILVGLREIHTTSDTILDIDTVSLQGGLVTYVLLVVVLIVVMIFMSCCLLSNSCHYKFCGKSFKSPFCDDENWSLDYKLRRGNPHTAKSKYGAHPSSWTQPQSGHVAYPSQVGQPSWPAEVPVAAPPKQIVLPSADQHFGQILGFSPTSNSQVPQLSRGVSHGDLRVHALPNPGAGKCESYYIGSQ